MKHTFATVVVFAIAGCATGQGVATGVSSPESIAKPISQASWRFGRRLPEIGASIREYLELGR